MRPIRFLIVLALSVGLTSSCAGDILTAKQRAAADDAMKALRKIEAATQVGVNYQQYGQLAIEAKAQVNEATKALPDGELKSEILAAMEAYGDAGSFWGPLIFDELNQGQKADLKSKYEIDAQPAYGDTAKKEQRSLILSTIWAAARERMQKAAALLDKKQLQHAWRFPGNGISVKQQNGGTAVYDLGDGFTGLHVQSPKKGHMVTVGVPPSVFHEAKETTSDNELISRKIAWEAFRKAGYPQRGAIDQDFIRAEHQGDLSTHLFRTADNEAVHAAVLVGNNALFKGSMVTFWKRPDK